MRVRRRSMLRRAARAALSAAALATLAALGCGRAPTTEESVMLAAAASLRVALPDLVKAYGAKAPGTRVAATYGASGDLRNQVEAGAPIDAVIFANAKPVDDLVRSGRVDPASRRVIATNRLVLIGPKGAEPLTFATLTSLPGGEKLAIGEPNAVPAGQYARDVLQKKGVWGALQGRLVFGGDVAAVLAYARRGEVAAAIVYATDVQGLTDVALLDEARGEWAPRVEVVAGVVQGAKAAPAARAFLDYLSSPEAQKILAERGFGAP